MKVADASTETLTSASKGKLGIAVRPLSDEEHAQAQVKNGLLVQDVAQGPAAKAGIRAGDVILAVNGDEVNSVKDLVSQVEKTKKTIALLIMRGDSKLYVPISLG